MKKLTPTHLVINLKDFRRRIRETKGHLEHHELKYWLQQGEKIVKQKSNKFGG